MASSPQFSAASGALPAGLAALIKLNQVLASSFHLWHLEFWPGPELWLRELILAPCLVRLSIDRRACDCLDKETSMVLLRLGLNYWTR